MAVGKAVEKPLEVEYLQWLGTNLAEFEAWLPGDRCKQKPNGELHIKSGGLVTEVKPNHVVIKYEDDALETMRPNYFNKHWTPTVGSLAVKLANA